MITRRQLLTTIAAVPLAKFCKTDTVRPYSIDAANGIVILHEQIDLPHCNEMLKRLHGKPVFNWLTGEFDGRRYALPQGTLG